MEGVIGWSQRDGYSIMAEPTRSSNKMSTVIYDDRCQLCVNAKKGMERLAQEDSRVSSAISAVPKPRSRKVPRAALQSRTTRGGLSCRSRRRHPQRIGCISSPAARYAGRKVLIGGHTVSSRQTPPQSRLSRSCPAPISLVWRSPSAPSMKRWRCGSSCAWLVLCAPASEGNDKPSGSFTPVF